MLPRVGGGWSSGADAGSFAVVLNSASGNATQSVGVRAVRFLSV